MSTNNTFSLTRFSLLLKHNLIHNYQLALRSALAFCGALFIVLLVIQFAQGSAPFQRGTFVAAFALVFGVTTVVCAGTAFPNLRSKQKTHHYLMLPASALEKFAVEFLLRILVVVAIVPILFWAVFNLQGYVISIFFPAFSFEGTEFSSALIFWGRDDTPVRMYLVSACLLALTIAFTGATMFVRYPLVKTVFSVAVIFFLNLFLLYFFLEILDFNQYHPTSPILFIDNAWNMLRVFTWAFAIYMVALLAAAYYKLKEREV